MSKTLAIKGRETQGIEVIRLLEMMGGKNCFHLHGLSSEHAYYFIGGPRNDEIRADDYIFDEYAVLQNIDGMCFFTLEEFWEKYPFKVGDKVKDCYGKLLTIRLMEWHNELETMVYTFEESDVVLAAKDIKVANDDQTKSPKMKSVLAELLNHIKTTPKEELEKEFKEIEEWSNVGPTVEEFMAFCESVNKKPKYPTSYKECCDVLGLNTMDNDACGYKADLIIRFQELYIARDAYWKIAGKEMGLGGPWESDWNDEIQKYCIRTDRNKIVNCSSSFNNRILAFPTVEMRDAFYENFKDLIENCKELL